MVRPVVSSLLFLLLTTLSHAADSTPRNTAEFLAPFLDNHVTLVARLDVTKINLDGFLGLEGVVSGSLGRSIQRLKPIANDLQKRLLAAGGTEIYLIYSYTSEDGGPLFLVAPLSQDSKQLELAKILGEYFGRGSESGSIRVGDALVVGNSKLAHSFALKKFKPEPRSEFAEAFATTTSSSLNIVVAPSQDQRRVLAELLPPLPSEFGSADIAQLVKGTTWLSLGVDLSDKPRGQFVAQTSSASDATRCKDFLANTLKYAASLPTLPPSIQSAVTSGKLIPKVSGNQVSLSLDEENQGVKSLTAILTELTSEWWETLSRVHVRNNMKQIGLAMHNFVDSEGHFPPSVILPKTGSTSYPVSWRVRILPLLDEGALYARYKQDEPWDSPNNIALVSEIPRVYTTLDQDPASGLTVYQLPTNENMIGGSPEGHAIKDFTDGTSNSIMVLQVDHASAVPWTKPQDFTVDLNDPWKGILAPDVEGTWAAIADGSARFLARPVDNENLLKFFTINGGEIISR